MIASIHIEITGTPSFVYERPVLSALKSQFPELVIYDIDTLSDASLINYAKDLMAEASRYVLIIEIKENQSAVKILPLLEANLKNKEKVLVIMNGSSAVVEKMLSLMPSERLFKNLSEDKQIEVATAFLNFQ